MSHANSHVPLAHDPKGPKAGIRETGRQNAQHCGPQRIGAPKPHGRNVDGGWHGDSQARKHPSSTNGQEKEIIQGSSQEAEEGVQTTHVVPPLAQDVNCEGSQGSTRVCSYHHSTSVRPNGTGMAGIHKLHVKGVHADSRDAGPELQKYVHHSYQSYTPLPKTQGRCKTHTN
jgi:hypothetical protein